MRIGDPHVQCTCEQSGREQSDRPVVPRASDIATPLRSCDRCNEAENDEESNHNWPPRYELLHRSKSICALCPKSIEAQYVRQQAEFGIWSSREGGKVARTDICERGCFWANAAYNWNQPNSASGQ